MDKRFIALLLVMSFVFGVMSPLPLWAAEPPGTTEDGDGGGTGETGNTENPGNTDVPAKGMTITWKYTRTTGSAGGEVTPAGVILYSNKTDSNSTGNIERGVNFTVTTKSGKPIRVQKSGDRSSSLQLSDGALNPGNLAVSLTPEYDVEATAYKADFRIELTAVPVGGLVNVELEVSQSGNEDRVIPITVMTLATTVGEQPKVITLGSNSLTNPKAGEWYAIQAGAHIDLDRNAGPLKDILSITGKTVNGVEVEVSNSKEKHGKSVDGWYYRYSGSASVGVFEIETPFTITYADSTLNTLNNKGSIKFFYSDIDKPVNSISIVTENGKNLPKLITSSTVVESIYFSVYANKGNKTNEKLLNGMHIGSSDGAGDSSKIASGASDKNYLEFSVKPTGIVKIAFNEDKGYCLERLVGNDGQLITGKFTLTAAYRADPTKNVEVSMACVAENDKIILDVKTMEEAFSGASFRVTEAKSAPVTAIMYLSSTSGFFGGTLNLQEALILASDDATFKNDFDEYMAKSWSVESDNTKVVTASLSGYKLTLKPVALGETTVTIKSYDTEQIVSLPIAVRYPEYESLQLSFKPGSTSISQTVYRDDVSVSRGAYNVDLPLAAGKSVKFGVKYQNTQLNETKSFDLPQGNGYWYSSNPIYVTATSAGVIKAIGAPPDSETKDDTSGVESDVNGTYVNVYFVDYYGKEVIRLKVYVSPKAQATDRWDDSLKLEYKGTQKGSISIDAKGWPTLAIGLYDKPYTLKASAAGKKLKVYYASSDPTSVYVSAKGVLTPLKVATDVKITIYSMDSGAVSKEAFFYVIVKK